MHMRTKYLAVALAVGMPLAAVGYLVWVFYATLAGYERTETPVPPPDPDALLHDRWNVQDPADPADLHGTWTSIAEIGSGAGLNRREAVLTFGPDGTLVWTTRATVGTAPPVETVSSYEYTCGPGPDLKLVLTAHSVNGVELGWRGGEPTFYRLDWTNNDKTSFQLRADPRKPGLLQLLFRKSPAPGEGWRLLGWDVTPPARP
jgi:hypothetical protein